MKVEIVSENMIKVLLFRDDLARWDVTYENMSSNDDKTVKMFWDIINIASKQTGIKFDNCKLIIEAVKKSKDCFVIFITKKSIQEKRYKFKKITSNQNVDEDCFLYTFSDMEGLITFTKKNPYYCFLFDGKNSIYSLRGNIKLAINISPKLRKYIHSFNNSICEYADIEKCSKIFYSHFNEHNKPIIAKNALRTIYYNL